ncbi:hypothetical protein BC936DRAFT_150157 [Jimgerdemannia flammicorona]|uniref:Uncharacterized protein n=1 Tax=Jimgerdemannia flammicorona TaxID=994334 RepID=A0A433DJK4_9FUNG|nr:hypothetical protein BC936DRAFT_150157 [Jimgerdemannia flammicorona]
MAQYATRWSHRQNKNVDAVGGFPKILHGYVYSDQTIEREYTHSDRTTLNPRLVRTISTSVAAVGRKKHFIFTSPFYTSRTLHMGCCGSKEDYAKPDEGEPLLIRTEQDFPRSYPRYEAIDHQLEQETLKQIVDRTAATPKIAPKSTGTLMTILAPLLDYIRLRTAALSHSPSFIISPKSTPRIRDLLAQIQIPKSRPGGNPSAGIPLGLSSSVAPQDVLARSAVLDDDDVSKLYKLMDDVQQALNKIEVENVGEIVVPLTLSNSAPIMGEG